MIQDCIKHDYWLWPILSLATEDNGRGNHAKPAEPGLTRPRPQQEAPAQPAQPGFQCFSVVPLLLLSQNEVPVVPTLYFSLPLYLSGWLYVDNLSLIIDHQTMKNHHV